MYWFTQVKEGKRLTDLLEGKPESTDMGDGP